MFVARGLPGFFSPERGTSFSDRRTVALFTATTLPLVIAVTQIGVEKQLLDESTAAALVGAAMVTVLLFPLFALVRRPQPETPPGSGSGSSGAGTATAHDSSRLSSDVHE